MASEPPAVIGVSIFGSNGTGTFDGGMRMVSGGTFGHGNDWFANRDVWWRLPRDRADLAGAKKCAASGLMVPARFVRMVNGTPYAPPFAPRNSAKENPEDVYYDGPEK